MGTSFPLGDADGFHASLSMLARCHRLRIATAMLGVLLVALPSAPAVSQQGNGAAPPGQTVRDLHRPDPCEQLLDVPGVARGLVKQCESKGGGSGVAKGDFNGDGFGDLAIGAPFEMVANVPSAGAVHVIYGTTNGLVATGNQLWNEANTSGGNGPETGDLFGLALASGDFNGDGASDLAIGVPRQGTSDAGGVHVLYGTSGTGLTTTGQRYLAGSSAGEQFGDALVWGNFNGDAFGDLVVGSPYQSAATLDTEAGGIAVYYGTAAGLPARQNQGFRQWFVNGESEEIGDHFGQALTAGRLNRDGYDDLVIGVPDEDTGFLNLVSNAGGVNILFGSVIGFQEGNSVTITDVFGQVDDRFGWSLAVGDFDSDGCGDLAVGSPFKDLYGTADVGTVTIYRCPYAGATRDNTRTLTQADYSQTREARDKFGWSLAAGKFDSDSYADLAIGSPGEDIGSIANAGIVTVTNGNSIGIGPGGVTWSFSSTNIGGDPQEGDQFGFALTAWNFGRGPSADLVIGVPYREVALASTGAAQVDAGGVLAIYSASTGLTSSGDQFWTLESPGILGAAAPGGRLGYALY